MSLITLQAWNNQIFSGRYTLNTLRSWARNGHIHPAPLKVGKDWMVADNAQYRKPEKTVQIPPNVEIDLIPTDALVLRILNQCSTM